jgi:Zn-dependent protease with chaperone function
MNSAQVLFQDNIIHFIFIILSMSTHEENCEKIFQRACAVLKLNGFTFKPKVIRIGDGYVKNYKLGYINLKSKLVVIDIYTQKLKKPKKYSSILAVIAHELAHHQKKPYRQFHMFRWINRIHYPKFYQQVKRNIEKFKKDGILGSFYR